MKYVKISVLAIILLIITSYYLLEFNYVKEPDPSNFKESLWMNFIPSSILGFRYLNFTQLSSFKGLFSTDVLFSFSGFSIKIDDVNYGIDVLTNDDEVVYIIALKQSFSNDVIFLIENQSSIAYKGFKICSLYERTLEKDFWVCYSNGILILSDSIDALKEILDPSDLLFSQREIKVGYLLTSLGEDQLSFYYVTSGENSYGVNWEMKSIKPGITVRYSLYFPSSSDLNEWYSEIAKTIFKSARKVYRSDNFIFGDFYYPPSEMRAVLMGL